VLQNFRGCDGQIPPDREGGQGGHRVRETRARGAVCEGSAAPRPDRAPNGSKAVFWPRKAGSPYAPKHRVLISAPRAVYLAQPPAARGGASLGSKGEDGAVGDNHEQAPRMAMYLIAAQTVGEGTTGGTGVHKTVPTAGGARRGAPPCPSSERRGQTVAGALCRSEV
jgi:hypothetical protein